jgi:Flp pilus assembly pilin Flp
MRKIKAQSVIEYAILIATVAAAFVAMNVYVRRAVNAKLHTIAQEINPSIVVEP